MVVADGSIDIRGHVPAPISITVRPSKVNALLGSGFRAAQIAELLRPLGIGADPIADPGRAGHAEEGVLEVTVPTFRPDIRPAPLGEADITEEVARTYGYSRMPRRTPSWPQPGRLTPYQRERRLLRDVLCGLGSSEVWTETFVSEFDQVNSGVDPPFVEVTNPLVESERFLRSSMMPGLIRVIRFNTERRQGSLRLFEVGTVFDLAANPPSGAEEGPLAETSERLTAIFALQNDDAWAAVAAWHTIAGALGIADWGLEGRSLSGTPAQVLHFYRSATIISPGTDGEVETGPAEPPTVLGVVGELNPYLVGQFGLLNPDGRPRQLGWLDLDIGVLLDRDRVPRRSEEARPISRYPSSDIDLAFVVREDVQADSVGRTLRQAGGELLESIELFDVYRGPPVEEGSRGLAFHLRFCAMDRTLTDDEIGALRAECIEAVGQRYSAALR
jgi:phenylalanyl-tRNA synthetase beta chain